MERLERSGRKSYNEWILNTIKRSDIVVFWIIEEDQISIQTNIEMGICLNSTKANNCYFGWPVSAINIDYYAFDFVNYFLRNPDVGYPLNYSENIYDLAKKVITRAIKMYVNMTNYIKQGER